MTRPMHLTDAEMFTLRSVALKRALQHAREYTAAREVVAAAVLFEGFLLGVRGRDKDVALNGAEAAAVEPEVIVGGLETPIGGDPSDVLHEMEGNSLGCPTLLCVSHIESSVGCVATPTVGDAGEAVTASPADRPPAATPGACEAA